MKKLFLAITLFFGFLSAGCQVGYIANNAYEQARLLHSAEPVKKVLEDKSFPEEKKRKLELAIQAKEFAESELKLKKTKNYTTYVELGRPFVTYALSASPKNELRHYTWYFPIVGNVPYKGYFSEESAKNEEKHLINDGYDTFVRGVPAYSTLGWFNDPILSSMMSYSDFYLVSTIIHETVHTTLYIKSNANFNERLASYLGDLGATLFFQKFYPETKLSNTSKDEDHDQKIFGEFISQRIKDLDTWYKKNQANSNFEEDRQSQFRSLQWDFMTHVLPLMKTKNYQGFGQIKLNNARLMTYKLYMNDLSDFKKLSQKLNNDFAKILEYCISLEKIEDPEKTLKEFTRDL